MSNLYILQLNYSFINGALWADIKHSLFFRQMKSMVIKPGDHTTKQFMVQYKTKYGDQKQTISSGKNLWHLPSLRCFILCGRTSKNYKLIIIPLPDPFLCIISTITDCYCVKCAWYNLKVLPCYHHNCNC